MILDSAETKVVLSKLPRFPSVLRDEIFIQPLVLAVLGAFVVLCSLSLMGWQKGNRSLGVERTTCDRILTISTQKKVQSEIKIQRILKLYSHGIKGSDGIDKTFETRLEKEVNMRNLSLFFLPMYLSLLSFPLKLLRTYTDEGTLQMNIMEGNKKITYLFGIIISSYLWDIFSSMKTPADSFPAGVVMIKKWRLVSPVFPSKYDNKLKPQVNHFEEVEITLFCWHNL